MPSRVKVSANHRRSISITLQLLDKTLCQWDEWTRGLVRSGVMYSERDTLSSTEKEQLRAGIVEIRKLIVRLRDELHLQPAILSTSQSIIGPASILWENAAELNSRSLAGYGAVSAELAEYLDPITQELASRINDSARLFSQPAKAKPDESAML